MSGQVFGEPAGGAVCPEVLGEVKLNSAKLAEVKLLFKPGETVSDAERPLTGPSDTLSPTGGEGGKSAGGPAQSKTQARDSIAGVAAARESAAVSGEESQQRPASLHRQDACATTEKQPVHSLPMDVDLDRAQVSKLTLSGALRPDEPPFFRFSGFQFDELDLSDLSDGSDDDSTERGAKKSLLARLGSHLAREKGTHWQFWSAGIGAALGGAAGALVSWGFGAGLGVQGGVFGALVCGLLLWWNVAPIASLKERGTVLSLEQMGRDRFDEAAYKNVEQWLRNRGRDEEADDVYLRMRSREWQFQPRTEGQPTGKGLPWPRKVFKCALLHLTGYGIRPLRVVTIWGVLYATAFVLFLHRDSVKLNVAHGSVATHPPVVSTNMVTNSVAQAAGTNLPPVVTVTTNCATNTSNLPEYLQTTQFLTGWNREEGDSPQGWNS